MRSARISLSRFKYFSFSLAHSRSHNEFIDTRKYEKMINVRSRFMETEKRWQWGDAFLLTRNNSQQFPRSNFYMKISMVFFFTFEIIGFLFSIATIHSCEESNGSTVIFFLFGFRYPEEKNSPKCCSMLLQIFVEHSFARIESTE